MGLLNKPYVREDEMFQVTENASAIIKDFLKDKEEAPSIRIMLNHGGWGGPSLGMALDGPKEDDETFNDNGITYVINSQLLEQVKPVNVDYIDTPMGAGFKISSSLASGGSCGTSCSSGGSCGSG